MLFLTKVKKFGMVSIMSVIAGVFGILWDIHGYQLLYLFLVELLQI